MSIHLVTHESAIRRQLADAANRIRSVLAGCPAVDDLDLANIADVIRSISEATTLVRHAQGLTSELDALRNASSEAIALVATSRAALQIVDEVLCTYTAALDARDAAA